MKEQTLHDSTPAPRLLTAQQAAQYLSLKPATLAQWRVEGRGPAYRKMGHAVRYTVEDLDAWIAASVVKPERGVAAHV